jgi:hypothetical protein
VDDCEGRTTIEEFKHWDFVFELFKDIIQKINEAAPNYLSTIFPLIFSWLDMGVNFLHLPCVTDILSLLPDSESDWESLQKLSNRVPDFTKSLFMYALQYPYKEE